MFYIEIMGSSGETSDGYSSSSLEVALDAIKEEVKSGVSLDNIRLYREVNLAYTIDVEVVD